MLKASRADGPAHAIAEYAGAVNWRRRTRRHTGFAPFVARQSLFSRAMGWVGDLALNVKAGPEIALSNVWVTPTWAVR